MMRLGGACRQQEQGQLFVAPFLVYVFVVGSGLSRNVSHGTVTIAGAAAYRSVVIVDDH